MASTRLPGRIREGAVAQSEGMRVELDEEHSGELNRSNAAEAAAAVVEGAAAVRMTAAADPDRDLARVRLC